MKFLKRLIEWFNSLFEIPVPELDYQVTFFTKHGGWTTFTFDNGNYYHGEISVPESFEGAKPYYFRWFDVAPVNRGLVEEFVYKEFQKI